MNFSRRRFVRLDRDGHLDLFGLLRQARLEDQEKERNFARFCC